MATTIQISSELAKKLKDKKLYDKETYEDVIWDLLEDSMEISKQTQKHIEESLHDYRAGKVHTHEQVKKELGF